MEIEMKFKLPEQNEEFEMAYNGNKMSIVLHYIANEIFRPARKHGYNDEELQSLIEKSKESREVVSKLEKMFYNILNEYNLNDLI